MKLNESTKFYAVVLDEVSIMTDGYNNQSYIFIDKASAQARLDLLKVDCPDFSFKIEECQIELLGEI